MTVDSSYAYVYSFVGVFFEVKTKNNIVLNFRMPIALLFIVRMSTIDIKIINNNKN